MDKIKTVKIKNPDGSISEESYTISVDAKDVDMANGKELQETIGTIDIDTDGNIAEQLENLNNDIDVLDLKIKEKAYIFNTVADMKKAKLQNGNYACTLGYYKVNDGGAGEYKIVSGDYVDDSGLYHSINNNLYAELIVSNGAISLNQFGAYGDGIHDDSLIIKKAFESGYKIIFGYKKTYLIGTAITITNSVDVDFNYSGLIFKKTITLKTNEVSLGSYSYTGKDIVLTGVNCPNGIFKITSPTQKWSDSKTQYKLGFSSYVKDNYLANPFDYDCDGDAIYCPYTYFNFKNIGDIQMYENANSTLIAFNIVGRVVNGQNIYAKEYGSLTLFQFSYCDVTVRDANLSSTIRPLQSSYYYYAFCISCCSKWLLENIHGLSDWHVVTTGGADGVSYNGIVKDCVFRQYQNKMYAFVEHENSYNTTLLNSYFDGLIINNGFIDNCTIGYRFGLSASYYEQYKRDTKINNSIIDLGGHWNILRTEFFNNDYYYGNVDINDCKVILYETFCIAPFVISEYYYKSGTLTFNHTNFIDKKGNDKKLFTLSSVEQDNIHCMFTNIYFNNCNFSNFRPFYGYGWSGVTVFINNNTLNIPSTEPAYFYASGLNLNINNSTLKGSSWNFDRNTQQIIFYNSLINYIRGYNEKYYGCRRTDTYEVIPDSENTSV